MNRLIAGVLLGAAAFAGWSLVQQAGDGEPVGDMLADPVTDFLDTWNMTNSEALQNPNVRAFLALIRSGEGTADQGGYSRLVGGGSFSSWGDHPNVKVWIDRIGDYSTAAGAYQILSKTWRAVKLQAGLPDFSPGSQDLAAVQLIRNKGALGDVLAGRINDALAKCSWLWASLPPWRYSKQGRMTTDDALAIYSNNGGLYV